MHCTAARLAGTSQCSHPLTGGWRLDHRQGFMYCTSSCESTMLLPIWTDRRPSAPARFQRAHLTAPCICKKHFDCSIWSLLHPPFCTWAGLQDATISSWNAVGTLSRQQKPHCCIGGQRSETSWGFNNEMPVGRHTCKAPSPKLQETRP